MAIFVSQLDYYLYDIILKAKKGELNAEIACIISNHELLKTIANYFNMPFYVFYKTKENRFIKENEELKVLNDYDVDYIVLACYMQLFSPRFVSQYQNRIINVHHSFLPAFKGEKAIPPGI
ncbi:MAG: formyltransferase family protein [Spirochaetota bacterium]